jgi:alpha-N-arabinofuranosidase
MCDYVERGFLGKCKVVIVLAFLLATWAEAHAQEMTRIELDASQTGAVISPLLFGHNLEVTRRGVWEGLSAEMVANRKFAAAAGGLPKRWTVIQGGSTVAIDDKVAYTGGQSVRVEVQPGGKDGGIRQAQETLAFKKNAKYNIRIWVKTDTDRIIQARLSDRSEKQIFEKEWHAKTGPWQLLSREFSVPSTAENCRLEISSQVPGAFWIGAVSVQPADSFHGMRRDVVALLKRIKPGALRYPGGCYADYYSWKDGLLPVDKRPSIGPMGFALLLPDTDDYDTQEIGIDEFIALCREIGSEPSITVRLSENTPADAGDWVKYCNGGSDTPWGAVRARRGHPKPYDVKCWFVGNEIYGFGRGGLNKPEVCARQTKLFAQAMKKADPRIRLTGCTLSTAGEWNHLVIGESGDLLDLFSVHDYLLDHFKESLPGIAMAPTQVLRPLLQKAQVNFRAEVSPDRPWGIAFDEWNTMWKHPGSAGMGLYAAGVLNLLCREAAPLKVERACFFMPINEGAIQVTPLTASLDIAGDVFELFKVHQGNRLLKTPEMAADADLDVCASETPDGRQIFVTAINRNLRDNRMIEFDLQHFKGSLRTAVKLLKPQTLEANARDVLSINQKAKIIEGQRVVATLPPGAIAGVRFGEEGSRE